MTPPREPITGPVVMVDDNAGDVFFAREAFEAAGCKNQWSSFPDGERFLDHLAVVRGGDEPMPDLVLLDINMPRLSGLEVLGRVRADPAFAQLPIICMLTSSTDPRDRAEAISRGASGFVTKPDALDEYVRFFTQWCGSDAES